MDIFDGLAGLLI